MKRLLAFFALFVFFGLQQVDAHTLFDSGRSAYRIVVADDASTTERYAAEELQYWLKQVGGANLSIVGERKGTTGKRILVGYGNEVKRLVKTARPKADDQGFVYGNVGGDVYIYGGKEIGTLYGVYLATKLEVAPNSSFLGSAYHISPFPIGLWIYNGLYPKEERGFRHWFWKHFKSDPTLVSQVNPELRAHAAEAALKDEGYFDASVDFDTIYNKKDSLKAKIAYTVNYAHKSRFGTITYMRSPFPRIDSIVSHTLNKSLLRSGDRFSYTNLDAERIRIADVLKDSGYYFFEPKFVKYYADSTQHGNTVNLRVMVGLGADQKALAPCTIDSVHFTSITRAMSSAASMSWRSMPIDSRSMARS